MKAFSSRPRCGKALMAAGFLVLLLAFFLLRIHIVGTDWRLYRKLQIRYGVQEENLEALDQALSEYLKGDETALLSTNAFGAKELLHMQDVFALFVLLRQVTAALFAAAAILLGAGIGLHGSGRLRACEASAKLGSLLLLLVMGVLGIWAWRDFTGLFHAFHRLLFRNELWLLNPQTDLLIRICPEGMFLDMLARILGDTLLFAVCLPLSFAIPEKILRRMSHELRNQNARQG